MKDIKVRKHWIVEAKLVQLPNAYTHTRIPGPGPGKHCHYGHVSPRGADNMENDALWQKVGSLPRDQGPCSIGTTREPSPAAMDLESTSRAAASATGPKVGLAA